MQPFSTEEEPNMSAAERKTFEQPDETRTFEKGSLDLVDVAGAQIGRLVLEPGWRWSDHVKPLAGTEWCEAPHFQYHVSGTLRIQMADGTELDAVAGDVTALPSGHDAWVVGDEPAVVIDWWGATDYAR
jgi:quercetin dioxygenase-like cupin family protein